MVLPSFAGIGPNINGNELAKMTNVRSAQTGEPAKHGNPSGVFRETV